MPLPAVTRKSTENMGHAYSKDSPDSAPSQFLSEPRGACHFVCTKNSPSSRNYNVYKDSADGPLWLFVRKTGHTFRESETTTMILENFHKEVLCVARLEPRSDDHFNPTFSIKNVMKGKLEGSTQVGLETIDTVAREELDWRYQSKARMYSGHSMTECIAELYVEAVGSVTRETLKIKGRDSENFPSLRTAFKEVKQVSTLQYLIHLVGGDDLVFSLEEPNSLAPSWDCPLFCASVIPSDDWRWRWDIQVKEGYDPSLSLLVGLVCSSVLTPAKIMNYLPVRWS